MKAKRGIILIIIVLMISVFSIACSNDSGEEVNDNSKDDNVQVDMETDEPSSETPEEPVEEEESKKWPAEKMGPLPEPDANVVSTEDFIDSTEVLLKFNDLEGPQVYLEKIMDLGFEMELVFETEISFVYEGSDIDDSKVKFMYDIEDQLIPTRIVYWE